MAKQKLDAPAVKTFADHEVIVPPHKLKEVAVVVPDGSMPDPVAAAEAALEGLSNNFAVWMQEECDRLDRARRKVGAAGFTGETRDELFRAAHDIKGEAETFGFPVVAPVAASLCRLIEHTPEADQIPLRLVEQHVDAVKAILHENAMGDAEKIAPVLAERLRAVTDEFLISVNRHRPDYLDGILSPPLVPGSEPF